MAHFFRIILILIFACSLSYEIYGQTKIQNMPEHDDKPYYFGLTFGFNYGVFQVSNTETFALTDTFRSIQASWGPGFNVGIMGNLKLSKFIDLRFVPALIFSEKKLEMISESNEPDIRTIEAIYMQLPLQLKFKSDRIHNFRFYGLLGGNFNYDLASNARSRRADEWLRISPADLGLEVGVGFDFFYPNFIFTPEIKISQGFLNQHARDHDIPLSNSIDAIRTRMIVFSIHLQG